MNSCATLTNQWLRGTTASQSRVHHLLFDSPPPLACEAPLLSSEANVGSGSNLALGQDVMVLQSLIVV